MQPEIWAAIIAAAASLIVAVAGLVSSRRAQKSGLDNEKQLRQFEGRLAEQAVTRNAWVAYEFEARKRLYEECAPLLFELSELSERAVGWIYGLARTAADGNLDPQKSWLGRGYYRSATYYRLVAPLSVGKLLRRRLTHLDLSIDANVRWQYTLVRVLMDSFTDDFDLAGQRGDVAIGERDWIDYRPHSTQAATRRLTEPQKFWQQGVPRGILDDAVTALIVDDKRIMEFSEFQAALDDAQSHVHRTFARIGYLFSGFHPHTRPVLWRVLVAQACLYEALLRSPRHGDAESRPDPIDVGLLDSIRLDWRDFPRSHEHAEEVAQAIGVGTAYAEQRVQSYFARRGGPRRDVSRHDSADRTGGDPAEARVTEAP